MLHLYAYKFEVRLILTHIDIVFVFSILVSKSENFKRGRCSWWYIGCYQVCIIFHPFLLYGTVKLLFNFDKISHFSYRCRRRFTVEQSVNITNPIEINLLYVQSRDAILDGSHPCTMEQAAKVHTSFSSLCLSILFLLTKLCLCVILKKSVLW